MLCYAMLYYTILYYYYYCQLTILYWLSWNHEDEPLTVAPAWYQQRYPRAQMGASGASMPPQSWIQKTQCIWRDLMVF